MRDSHRSVAPQWRRNVLTLLATLALATPAVAETRPYAEGKRPLLSNMRAFPNLTIIYRFTGLHDNGGAATTGTAASVVCSNWGPPATIRTVLRSFTSNVIGIVTTNIATGETVAGSTKPTAYMNEDTAFFPGGVAVNQGSLLVYSTSPQVQCAAFNLDAAGATPAFLTSLPAQRQNPPAGTTE